MDKFVINYTVDNEHREGLQTAIVQAENKGEAKEWLKKSVVSEVEIKTIGKDLLTDISESGG